MDTTRLLDWAWLAGLFDGEGCFTITYEKRPPGSYHVRAAVSLRADDWQTLQFAMELTAVGRLRYKGKVSEDRPRSNPALVWEVSRIDDCITLSAGLLAAGGLRSKKNRDFIIWQEALALLDEHGGGSHSPAAVRLAELKEEMHRVKVYSGDLATGADPYVGVRVLKRGGRGSHAFWAGDTEQSRRERQSRQLRYAKLSQPDIDAIIARVAAGERRSDIAADFDISVGLISKFVSGKYLRRDGTLAPVENPPALKPTDPAFWKTEAGQRAHRNQAARGKLSQAQIDELVARYNAGGVTTYQLAEEYDVSRPLISKFIKGNYIRRV